MKGGRFIWSKLSTKNCIFLCCDLQEVFRPLIFGMPQVIASAQTLMKAADVLEIPVIGTEQSPTKLGKTVLELDFSSPLASMYSKTKFSMVTDEVRTEIEKTKRENVILFGAEAHVCVFQTALDLLESGYTVHLIVDGISSQRQSDRNIALERLRSDGCLITSTESLLFSVLKDASHENFRAISKLVKEYAQKIKEQPQLSLL